jgi:serine/threonine protein kinase
MSTLTLDEVERLLAEFSTPADLFAQVAYRKLALATHPDRHPGDPRAVALFKRIEDLYDQHRAPGPTVRSPKRTYALDHLLAAGDVADVYLAAQDSATALGAGYVVKVSRVPGGDTLLDRERKSLTTLLTAAGDATYRKYLPTLAESFPVFDSFPRRVNVFLYEPGFYTLDEVHARHPVLDPRHLAWVFKRLLTALGFAHREKVIHGAVLPPHVLIYPASHGLQLIGWGQSVDNGCPLAAAATRYQDWYPPEVSKKEPATPATDLFLAARCIADLAGGGPAGPIPDSVPAPFARFLRACLLDGPRMRPDNAWTLLDEFEEMLGQLYGPPRFHELSMD